jgi:hypothetical protein
MKLAARQLVKTAVSNDLHDSDAVTALDIAFVPLWPDLLNVRVSQLWASRKRLDAAGVPQFR